MIVTSGTPRVGPNAKTGEREKAWLDRYQEEFAWGGGGVGEIRKIFEMAATLPGELRQMLLTQYCCGLWFKDPTEQLIAERFFNARSIDYRGCPVVMPLIEMANHGAGAHYDTSNGIALRGSFPGEIVVEYSQFDSLDFFLTWGFATQRPLAFSITLQGKIDSTPLNIDQRFGGTVEFRAGMDSKNRRDRRQDQTAVSHDRKSAVPASSQRHLLQVDARCGICGLRRVVRPHPSPEPTAFRQSASGLGRHRLAVGKNNTDHGPLSAARHVVLLRRPRDLSDAHCRHYRAFVINDRGSH